MDKDQALLRKASVVELSFNLLSDFYPEGSDSLNNLTSSINSLLSSGELNDEVLNNEAIDNALFILLIPYTTRDNYIEEGKFIDTYEMLKSYSYALTSEDIKVILKDLLFVLEKSTEYLPLSLPLFIAKTFGSNELRISNVYVKHFRKILLEIALELNKESKEGQLSIKQVEALFGEPLSDVPVPSRQTLAKETKTETQQMTLNSFSTSEPLTEEDSEELYFKLYIPPVVDTAAFNADQNKKIGIGVFAICIVTAAFVLIWTNKSKAQKQV